MHAIIICMTIILFDLQTAFIILSRYNKSYTKGGGFRPSLLYSLVHEMEKEKFH